MSATETDRRLVAYLADGRHSVQPGATFDARRPSALPQNKPRGELIAGTYGRLVAFQGGVCPILLPKVTQIVDSPNEKIIIDMRINASGRNRPLHPKKTHDSQHRIYPRADANPCWVNRHWRSTESVSFTEHVVLWGTDKPDTAADLVFMGPRDAHPGASAVFRADAYQGATCRQH